MFMTSGKIKDVSKQWAMMLESEEEEQKKYSEACDEACKKAKELEEQELEDIDEEVIDPSELGFTEEEVECNEVVDPLQLWKDAKKENKGPMLMKVDNNYINKMKKLLSRIKSSKSQLYHQIIDVKLPEYMKNGTQLPCPEDFAENFIPFEQIDRSFDKLGDPRGEEYKDTEGAFGNDLAMQNMYDSELTEAEEADVKKEFNDACEKAKDATKKDPKVDEVKEYLKSHKEEIEKNIKKMDPEVQDRVRSVMKILDKWANGLIVVEGELNEKKKDSIPLATIKLLFRFINLVVFGIPCLAGKGVKMLGAVGGFIDKYSKKALDKIDDKLAESVALEVEDDKQTLEEADAEELDADGNPIVEAEKEEITEEETEIEEDEELKEEVNKELAEAEKEEIKEADDREPAAHLLDIAGVKASTASLNGENSAMLSIVESLLKKIDKLETKLDEACSKKEKEEPVEEAEYIEVDDFFKEGEEEEKKAEETSEVSEKEISDMEKFLDSEEVEEAEEPKLMSAEEFVGEADTSFDDENGEEPEYEDPNYKAKEEEINKALKKAKFYQELSYERDLRPEELDEFRDLINKIPEERRYELEEPLGKGGFARPGNHTGVFVTDIGGSGERVEVPPFNPNATALKFDDKAEEETKEIKFPKRGSSKTWSTTEWNAFLSSIDPKRREELMKEIIDDIENMTPEEAEESSSEPLKGKPTDMQKAHQVSFVKSIFGKYTSGNKIKIDTRDLGRMLGKSHAGVGKYANETIEMIRDAMKKATGKSNPSIADFNNMTAAEFNKVRQHLEINVGARQRRKTGVDASVAPLPGAMNKGKED